MSFDERAGLDACTRCGLCLQACPTYRVLGLEPDSPRGRVFLMKEVADGAAEVGPDLAEHLYICLGCRACETACPSGVPFGRLLERGRARVEERGEIDASRRGWRIFRALALGVVLPNPALFSLMMAPARWIARTPWLAKLLRALPLPSRVKDLVSMIPRSPGAGARVGQAGGARTLPRARVGLFTGCIMGALFPHVHEALVRVLRHNGCDVVVPQGQWCCGALNVHAGDRRRARTMARRNIAAFEASNVDAIVLDSAGCGAVLKEYGELLSDDARYAGRARGFASKVKDAAEFLQDLGPLRDLGRIDRRVTYQDACHLAHAQGIRSQPRELLAMIPGLQVAEMANADRCCGAAGLYSLTHHAMSARIREEKMRSIALTGAQSVVVTNPGCHMQLLAGAARSGETLQVSHLVELLDEAYSRADPVVPDRRSGFRAHL